MTCQFDGLRSVPSFAYDIGVMALHLEIALLQKTDENCYMLWFLLYHHLYSVLYYFNMEVSL